MDVGFKEGGDKAFYSPAEDFIMLPEAHKFKSDYSYMATFLHEAAHATGNEKRLNRELSTVFGSPEYAKEELRAEISAAFMAQSIRLNEKEYRTINHTYRAGYPFLKISRKNYLQQ